jgi:hypothetical protein
MAVEVALKSESSSEVAKNLSISVLISALTFGTYDPG